MSTAAISQYLEGIDFPADKRQIIAHVERRNAPELIVETLKKMPGEKYSSMAGIWHAVGKVT